jgi:hypothetical protein
MRGNLMVMISKTVIVLEVSCRESFVQLDLKPAASAGSHLLQEPGDPGLEVEIHVVLVVRLLIDSKISR